jgi:glutamate-1-semialdehyde 2,1-aminomutase
MRAGAAAISHLLTPCALSSLNSLGDVLRQSSNDLFQRLSVPLEMTGLGSINQLKPTSGAPRETLELVYFGLLEKGIAIAQRGLISLTLSITLAQVERFVSGLEEVLVGLGRVLDP